MERADAKSSSGLAAAVVEHLIFQGVTEWIVCAGARNAAFVVLLAGLEQRGMRVWHHFEERAAAFFALGRVRVLGKPVAVVTTSGTAVAELLPAAVEAHYEGLPLVLVTADRPQHFRGSGAPQAIEQAALFGPYADCHDLSPGITPQDWRISRSSPTQVNVCLDEPSAGELEILRTAAAVLLMDGPAPVDIPADAMTLQGGLREEVSDFLNAAGRPLILLGDLLDGEISAALALLAGSEAPVWAEAASGLREHATLQARLVRGDDKALRLSWDAVLRIGGVPSCRLWRDLESMPGIPVLSIHRAPHTGLGRRENVRALMWPAGSQGGSIYSAEQTAGAAGSEDFALQTLLSRYPQSEPALIRALSLTIPPGALILTGNSLPVREWNLAATSAARGSRVHTLRGANGIDGNLSAWLGLAAEAAESWAIVGDLTALYDLAAPWMLGQLPAARRRIVVVNNGGGRIFSRLPSLKALAADERRLMENPHGIDLAGWAALWRMEYYCADSWPVPSGPGDFLPGLADHAIIELRPCEVQTEAFWQEWNR